MTFQELAARYNGAMPRHAGLLLLALALAGRAFAQEETLPVPPVPPRIAEGGEYERCLDMLATDPAGAESLATAWKDGGEAAAHCHALAEIELGNPQDGAAALESLARTSHSPASSRAELLLQASAAWLMAGQPRRALAASSDAVALNADDPDLRIARARAAIEAGQAADAVADLDRALSVDSHREDALLLRARAHRAIGDWQAAADDCDRALAIDDEDPDAWLERGILLQHAGDTQGARDAWMKVQALDPDGEVADRAEQNLSLLDAGPAQ